MRKKIQGLLSVLLTLCIAVNLLSVTALAAASDTESLWDISASEGAGQVMAQYDSNIKTLTISGTGSMKDYTYNAAVPWASLKQEITKVVVENGVTNVGAYAFSYCRNLSGVSLPDSLTRIGTYAFHATSVKRLTIPASVDTIGRMIATPNTYFEVLGNPQNVNDHAFSTSLVSAVDKATAEALNSKTNVSALIVLDGGTYGTSDADLSNLSYGLIAPVKEGYTFLGWYRDDGFTKPCKVSEDGRWIVNINNIYYAKWTDGKVYTVSFDSQGGSAVASQTVAANGKVLAPVTPSRSGYSFDGWFTDSACTSAWDFNAVVTGNLTLYAKWITQEPGTPDTPSDPSSPSNPGTSGTPTTPTVTTGKDTQTGLSTTTTAKPSATVKDGVAASTVSSAMGSEIVKQAEQNKSDNVVIAPEIKGDVTSTEVTIPAHTVSEIGNKTEASLTVSTPVADVTIPNGALNDLAKSGENVTVTATQTGDNSIELTVTAGGKTVDSIPGGMKVTVPVEAPTPGTVAVIVREDGTREVVRKSTAGEDSIVIPLDGSAKVEIVDNSKKFSDVPATSWASGAVAFASSHELFNGTSETEFSPELPMSRGMLAVVLHNLENNPSQAVTGVFTDVDSDKWYAEGIAWAAEKGIVTGYGNGRFNPDDDITREQLAVMLWRYAGSPAAAEGELNFSDADKTSSWALEAMRWATEKGIINGKGSGILDPNGKATRAQAAQMLKNFMEKQ